MTFPMPSWFTDADSRPLSTLASLAQSYPHLLNEDKTNPINLLWRSNPLIHLLFGQLWTLPMGGIHRRAGSGSKECREPPIWLIAAECGWCAYRRGNCFSSVWCSAAGNFTLNFVSSATLLSKIGIWHQNPLAGSPTTIPSQTHLVKPFYCLFHSSGCVEKWRVMGECALIRHSRVDCTCVTGSGARDHATITPFLCQRLAFAAHKDPLKLSILSHSWLLKRYLMV